MPDNEKSYEIIDREWVTCHFPKRAPDTNKGSFGNLSVLVGSDKYRGAAHLVLSSAVRGGAGICRFIGTPSLCAELRCKYPEVIYIESDIRHAAGTLASADSALIGCGSDISEGLSELCREVVAHAKGRVILDADALNSISRFSTPEIFLKGSGRVVITPHPLEFSRISGMTVEEILSDRIGSAQAFSKKYGCITLLKGNGTVITDGIRTLVNTTGSPALAKGGSGDVLSGLIASLSAHIHDPLEAAAIGAYFHGLAGDTLAVRYSSLGVTPSDLSTAICSLMAEIESQISN